MQTEKNIQLIAMILLLNLPSINAKDIDYKFYRDKFLIVPESQTYADSFGMVMICPAHAHGTPDEAMAKLKKILETFPSNQVSTIWVCRADQTNTLRKFAPVVDRIVVNTFALTSNLGPKKGDPIWPKFDHPFLNHIRELRNIAGKKNLLGCIDVAGESGYFKDRSISFEEIEWMVYALVGANYQGIVWRGNLDSLSWGNRLHQLESSLGQYSDTLGVAEVVNWVTTSTKQPISALITKNYLFIVLLNTEHLKLSEITKRVVLPLDTPDCRGSLSIQLPKGIRIISGKTLSGLPVKITHQDKSIQIPYHYRGGGEIIVLSLTHETTTTSQTQQEAQP